MKDLPPLPATSPLEGVLWSWIVPALLFLVAFGATWALYRHFAAKPADGGRTPER